MQSVRNISSRAYSVRKGKFLVPCEAEASDLNEQCKGGEGVDKGESSRVMGGHVSLCQDDDGMQEPSSNDTSHTSCLAEKTIQHAMRHGKQLVAAWGGECLATIKM